jgi:hypothetical protein
MRIKRTDLAVLVLNPRREISRPGGQESGNCREDFIKVADVGWGREAPSQKNGRDLSVKTHRFDFRAAGNRFKWLRNVSYTARNETVTGTIGWR